MANIKLINNPKAKIKRKVDQLNGIKIIVTKSKNPNINRKCAPLNMLKRLVLLLSKFPIRVFKSRYFFILIIIQVKIINKNEKWIPENLHNSVLYELNSTPLLNSSKFIWKGKNTTYDITLTTATTTKPLKTLLTRIPYPNNNSPPHNINIKKKTAVG